MQLSTDLYYAQTMRRFLSATALVLTLTVFAASCSGGDDNASDDVPGVDVAAEVLGTGTVREANTELGDVLTTDEGYTLYYLNLDPTGVSTCDADCTILWPPYQPNDLTGATEDRLTHIDRDDGSKQAALDGKPLYLFTGDVLPGDTLGHGSAGVWVAVGSDGAALPL